MRFIKNHYKITTLLFLTVLFVYISHVRENFQDNIDEIVCIMTSNSPAFDIFWNHNKKEDKATFEEVSFRHDKDFGKIKACGLNQDHKIIYPQIGV